MQQILVIDDEKPTLTMFRLLLTALGYEVLTADNGALGLDIFAARKPAIVLTDIKMPGMDGFEILEQIKQAAPRTEVIVITGHGDTDLAREALKRRAAAFIHKPIQREALEAALRQARKRLGLPEE